MAIDVIRSKIVIAGLSYVKPVFTANYLQIKVIAEVTMPDVLNVDIVTPTDLVSLTTTKSLADTTDGFADALAQVFGKHLDDQQYLADDTVIGDIQPHRDGIDAAYPTDTITGFSFEKCLADTFETLDEATAVRLFQREFNDSVTAPDAEYYSFTPKTKTDSATTSDTSYRGVDKALSDVLTMVDNMDGNIQHHFFKTTNDLISEVDAQVIDFKPNKADNVVTSSSGILSMQDYCDITYFLEDYVGLSRTFT